MIRFIHTADVHFGVENYGKIDPQTGIHSRLNDFYQAFMYCIDYAIDQRVDFFLFCGDAYKNAYPSPTQQRLLVRSLLKLYQAHIPVIIIVGNHDHPLSFGKAHALDIFGALPIDGFYVVAKPTVINLQTTQGPINIVAIPWPTRNTIALSSPVQTASSITDYLSQQVGNLIAHYAQQLDPDVPAILAGHLTVSTALFSGSEKKAIYGTDPIFLPTQLAIAPFDYIALGHLHRHQRVNMHAAPPIVYAGSIERIDFGERSEEKGFCLVTITQKGSAEYQFIPVPTRRFIQIDAKLTSNQEMDQTRAIIDEIDKNAIKDAIIKVTYEIPEDITQRIDLRAIQAACVQAHYVVDITPIRPPAIRERRINIEPDTTLETLLHAYFKQRPEWAPKADQLVARVQSLMAETEATESPEQHSGE